MSADVQPGRAPFTGGWRDRHGDVWHYVDDGPELGTPDGERMMITPETNSFPRAYVEKKWGPLIAVSEFDPRPELEPVAPPAVILNPDPLPSEPGDYWGTERYPTGAVFVLPVDVQITVPGLHLECTCSETVDGAVSRASDRVRLVTFAARHAGSCGFPLAAAIAAIGEQQ